MTETVGIEIGARQLTDPAFQAVARNIEEINRASQAMARSTSDTARGMADMSSTMTGATVKGNLLFEILKKIAEVAIDYHNSTRTYVTGLQGQAEAVRLNTDAFQALVYVGNTVAVTQEKTAAALAVFARQVEGARAGERGRIENLDKLNVKILDHNGRVRDQAVLVSEAASAILRMSNADEQAAAAKAQFGLEGSKTLPLLREFARGADETAQRATNAGVIIDADLTKRLNELTTQGANTQLAIRKFYAEIGMPIELAALKAVSSLVGGIADNYRRARLEEAAFRQQAGAIAATNDTANLQDQLAAQENLLKINPNNKSAASSAAALRKRIEESRQAAVAAARVAGQGIVNDADLQRLINDGLPAKDGGASNPTKPPPATAGGGGETRDRIQEAINRLNGEAKAAQKALSDMMGGADKPLKDLEQQVALQKKIADEIAKLGRYNPSDPRVADIRALVQEHEKAETALKKYQAAARDADQVERQSGDGRLYLRDETQRLNEALDTGRLSYEAYAVSIRQAQEKANDMSLTLQGQQQGLQGLVAGMEFAAAQWERNNRAFQRGQQFFNSSVNLMSQSLSDFVTKGEVDFNRLLGSFVQMLSNMALQGAATSLFNSGSGVLGDLFSGLFSAGLSAGTGAGGVADGSYGGRLTYGGPRASGGPVDPSMIYQVGEHGPEFFIPKTPGNILNASQMNAVGGGGRGDTFIVHQTNHFGSDVSRAEMARWASVVEQRARDGAMSGVIDNRRRGGSMKTAFS